MVGGSRLGLTGWLAVDKRGWLILPLAWFGVLAALMLAYLALAR